jgi:hypothetical protein
MLLEPRVEFQAGHEMKESKWNSSHSRDHRDRVRRLGR